MKRIHIAIIVNLILCIILYFFSTSSGKTIIVTSLNREKVHELLRDSKVRVEDNMIIKKVKTANIRDEIYLSIYCKDGKTIESAISRNDENFGLYSKKHGIPRNLLYNISKIILIVLIILAVRDIFGDKKEKQELTEEDNEKLRNM